VDSASHSIDGPDKAHKTNDYHEDTNILGQNSGFLEGGCSM
jgi:hypothetical protein